MSHLTQNSTMGVCFVRLPAIAVTVCDRLTWQTQQFFLSFISPCSGAQQMHGGQLSLHFLYCPHAPSGCSPSNLPLLQVSSFWSAAGEFFFTMQVSFLSAPWPSRRLCLPHRLIQEPSYAILAHLPLSTRLFVSRCMPFWL